MTVINCMQFRHVFSTIIFDKYEKGRYYIVLYFSKKKKHKQKKTKKKGKKKKEKGKKNEVKFNCTVFADKYYDIGK